MSTELISALVMVLLFAMIFLGTHVGLAMALAGLIGTMAIIPVGPTFRLFGQTVMETSLSFELSVIPLFVLMGAFTSSSGLSRDLYEAFNAWLGARRGGLAMATIAACGAFGAISGSSVATAATMSEVAMPEMRRYGYANSLAAGAIAAGGTIGILIPPSVIMVLYGIMTQTSIVDLFIAGIVPGILLVVLFLLTVAIIARLNPASCPAGTPVPMADRLRALRKVGGVLALFLIVLGGLYGGVFTPTEGAGIGAAGALLITLVMRRMSWAAFVRALADSVRTTVMIFTILIGALVFKNFMVLAQLPDQIEGLLAAMTLSPFGTLLAIIVIYLVLGALMDTMAMILLTVPIFFPLMTALGYDAVWFGVLIVVLVELALITPPMGMNVFVINGLTPDVPLSQIFRGVMPFCLALAVLIALLVAFPQIALFPLPHGG
ncbi:MAG: TRAP transporter large permease [Rhodobacter sp.]|nr:TRAP transporter large permease [Paracoccaceae bacterium]MCC0076344.1 TRAP transporter large permease [Rhodobacter sp.]